MTSLDEIIEKLTEMRDYLSDLKAMLNHMDLAIDDEDFSQLEYFLTRAEKSLDEAQALFRKARWNLKHLRHN